MLADALGRAVERHEFDLLAFVFMPEHVHLMVKCRVAEYRTSGLLYAIKKPSSFRVRELLEEARDPLVDELIIRERPGKTAFRFWQEGPWYNRNLTTEDALVNALRYIHRNPVRRGRCTTPEQWPWSSFHPYVHPDALPPNGHPQVRRLKI